MTTTTTQTPADAPASAVTQMKENTMPTTNDPATVDRPLEAADAPQDATDAPLDAPAPEAAPEDAPEPDDAHEAAHGREAAKYRRALREAEADREILRGQVATLRRAAVATAIEHGRVQGTVELLDAAGVNIDDLLDEAGAVDSGKVIAALDAAAKKMGVSIRLPAAPSAHGQGNVGKPVGDGTIPPAFAHAFAPRGR